MTLRCLFVSFNFYFAPVEQQDYLALHGHPATVAPAASETTCCIAASDEAKAFDPKKQAGLEDARKNVMLRQRFPAPCHRRP